MLKRFRTWCFTITLVHWGTGVLLWSSPGYWETDSHDACDRWSFRRWVEPDMILLRALGLELYQSWPIAFPNQLVFFDRWVVDLWRSPIEIWQVP